MFYRVKCFGMYKTWTFLGNKGFANCFTNEYVHGCTVCDKDT